MQLQLKDDLFKMHKPKKAYPRSALLGGKNIRSASLVLCTMLISEYCVKPFK